MMKAVTLCLVLLALGNGAQAAMDRESLRAHCRLMMLYVGGPGSSEDFTNRWQFYMADQGNFDGATTKEGFAQQIADEWGKYKLFNHVINPSEPTVDGSSCMMEATHSFLAWDGSCGPLIGSLYLKLDIDPTVSEAKDAKMVGIQTFYDKEALRSQIESCNPDTVEKAEN